MQLRLTSASVRRYTIDNLMAGTYTFRVMAVSLAGDGSFTDFHEFSIVDSSGVSKGWYLLASIVVLFVGTAVVLYYYKNKIKVIISERRQADTVELIQDIELTDFRDAPNTQSPDGLSDIAEFDLELDE